MFSLKGDILKGRVVNNAMYRGLIELCYNLGGNLRPITFGDLNYFQQKGIDISNISDIFSCTMENNNPLWYELASFYADQFEESLNLNDYTTVRAILFDYLLRSSLCSVEVDKVQVYGSRITTVSGKFLSSKNATIVGCMQGVHPTICANTYEKQFDICEEQLRAGQIPYIKISPEAEKKIVKANKLLNVLECRIAPLELIDAWLRGLVQALCTCLVEIKYLKDDGEIRTLVSTLNRDILRQYYTEDRSISMLNLAVQSTEFQCSHSLPFRGKADRCWIHMPEVGSSIIDDNGVRAVNFMRIFSLRQVNEVDTTFINISLSEVIEKFNRTLEMYIAKSNAQAITALYNALRVFGFSSDLKTPVQMFTSVTDIAKAIREFISTKQYVGTEFRKSLHLFMTLNRELFPDYIASNSNKIEKRSFGVATMDF